MSKVMQNVNESKKKKNELTMSKHHACIVKRLVLLLD